jgi:hypothetical protein
MKTVETTDTETIYQKTMIPANIVFLFCSILWHSVHNLSILFEPVYVRQQLDAPLSSYTSLLDGEFNTCFFLKRNF